MLAAFASCGESSARTDAIGGSALTSDDTALATAAPVEVFDDAGRAVRLARPARRIVSLVPAITETLVAMGAEDLLVARTDYDEGVVEYLPSVGGGLTPSLELIASVEPDLVVVWEEAAGARIRPRLEALGIPVFAAQTRDTADIFANIERLGALAGMQASADSLAAWVRSEFDAVRASVVGLRAPRVLYLVGVDPAMVAGPNLFVGEALSVAGAENVFPDVDEASPQMSVEEIVRRRPEIVLLPVSGPGDASIAQLIATPGWAELYASGETRFEALPADLLQRPGPGIAAAAWLLRDVTHPESAGRR